MEFLTKSTDNNIRPFTLASANNAVIKSSRYEFDLKSFLDIQIGVIAKGEELENLLIKEIGSGLFIHKLDRFILHIFEEIEDIEIESGKGLKHEGIATEIVDLLMFVGAVAAVNRYNMESFMLHNAINPTLGFNSYESNINIKTQADLDSALLSVASHMISIRRLFPQRKWSSVNTDMVEIEAKRAIYMINGKIETAIIEILQLLISVYGDDLNIINRSISEKNIFVRGIRII